MNESVRFTYLNQREIQEKLSRLQHFVSLYIIKLLLSFHGLGKRSMVKSRSIKQVEGRNEQFENINDLRSEFVASDNPIISIDSKKKENLGNLHRKGKVYTDVPLEAFDHDFPNLRTGQVVLHGIFDLKGKEGYMTLCDSHDTAKFVRDNLLWWWNQYGRSQYPKADTILILCDGGGSNSSRHYLFKEALQYLADHTGMIIRIAHYPAYCSKYNPIERKLFPYVTKALEGLMLDGMETMKKLIEERAINKSGLKVVVNITEKQYQTKIKPSHGFKENMKIQFCETIPKWNYMAIPEADLAA